MTKKERADAIIERYKAGETLNEIGCSFGITRERVRQILKDLGIDPMTGGSAIKRLLSIENKVKTKRDKERKREERNRRIWGISASFYSEIRREYGYKPFEDFTRQRQNSSKRNIEWGMTFGEWWSCWQLSGRWGERGKGYGYCMARVGDTGPYAVGNVYICTGVENLQDQRRNIARHEEIGLST